MAVHLGFVIHKVALGQFFIHLLLQLQTPSNESLHKILPAFL